MPLRRRPPWFRSKSMIATAMCTLTVFAPGTNNWHANAKTVAGTGGNLMVATVKYMVP